MENLPQEGKSKENNLEESTASSLNPALAIVFSLGFFLLITSTFYPLSELTVFDAKRILELGLFVAVLVSAVAFTKLRLRTIEQLNRLGTPERIAIALFIALGIWSSLRLDQSAYALVDVLMIIQIMVLFSVVAASRRLAGTGFDLCALLLLSSLGVAVFIQEFMGYLAGWVGGFEFSYNHSLIHFAHPRFYNQLQTWSIPVLAALPLLFPGKRGIRQICVILLGLQWFLVISTAARGTTVSLVISMLFIALWVPQHRKFWLKYQLAGVIAGIVIYAGIYQVNESLSAQPGSFFATSVGRPMAHTSGRSYFWNLTIDDAIDQPILGTGPTRFGCDRNVWVPAHPHSILFRIIGEWGFIAFGLLLFIAVLIGSKFLTGLRQQHGSDPAANPLRSILAISLIAGVIHACLSGLFIMPASQVAMILLVGWKLGLDMNSSKDLEKKPIALFTLLLGTMIGLAVFVFALSEIQQMPAKMEISNSGGPMTPRFWQNGELCDWGHSLMTPN